MPWLLVLPIGWAMWVGGCTRLTDTTWSPHFTPMALVQAARSQIDQTVEYDGRYQRLAYPMGDVPIHTGVCSDVVIRAFRVFGLDLQQEVCQCIRSNQSVFAKQLTNGKADRSIDHRRVKILAVYFHLHGWDNDTNDLQPGDLVIMDRHNGHWHIVIVSNKRSSDQKRWLVIHNKDSGVQEEDMLKDYPPLYCFRAPSMIMGSAPQAQVQHGKHHHKVCMGRSTESFLTTTAGMAMVHRH